jgi:glucose-1-phosphate cytidylyltransferase
LKVIILAGGYGTRISEETNDKPKPMVQIDKKPILWHVMNIYASQGYCDFLIATGYKHEVIENYVSELESPWNIECLFTGDNSQTAWRIAACLEYLKSSEHVFITYGDGVGNVDLAQLKKFHTRHGKLATVTAVRPPARFGVLEFENAQVTHFGEKNQADSGWINGGFFIVNPEISRYVSNATESFEIHVLPKVVSDGELMAYEHAGFWQPMDTLREKNILTELSKKLPPPWLHDLQPLRRD